MPKVTSPIFPEVIFTAMTVAATWRKIRSFQPSPLMSLQSFIHHIFFGVTPRVRVVRKNAWKYCFFSRSCVGYIYKPVFYHTLLPPFKYIWWFSTIFLSILTYQLVSNRYVFSTDLLFYLKARILNNPHSKQLTTILFKLSEVDFQQWTSETLETEPCRHFVGY